MPGILLHVCCGPCSLMPIVHLRDEGWEPVAYFFNPNIHPADEWKKRRDAMREVAVRLNVPLLEEGEPENPGLWVRHLDGTTAEGARCRLCYRPRMERAATLAAEKGLAFTTSLLYSRYQHHETIMEEARRAAEAAGSTFLYQDFRPWWWDGIAMSKELGIYRQKWCGCILSMKEALAQHKAAEERKAAQKAERAARLAAEAEERRKKKEAFAAGNSKKARKALARLAKMQADAGESRADEKNA